MNVSALRVRAGKPRPYGLHFSALCRCKSNYHSPSKLEGVARSVGGWIKYPSVPQRGEYSALYDGDRRLSVGGGRMSVNACFYTIIMLAFFTDSSVASDTSPNLGEEL